MSVAIEPTFKLALAELSTVKAVALAICKVVTPVVSVPLSFIVTSPAFASFIVVAVFVPPWVIVKSCASVLFVIVIVSAAWAFV